MLGNTLVLPQAGGDITLIKINQDQYSSEYLFKNSTGTYRAKIRHNAGTTRRANSAGVQVLYDRHNFEVVQTIFAAGDVPEYERKFYFVLEVIPSETSVALPDAVADLMIATSNAFMTSLLNFES
jgi:hypothetical protein